LGVSEDMSIMEGKIMICLKDYKRKEERNKNKEKRIPMREKEESQLKRKKEIE
jgi:hypothetical protein